MATYFAAARSNYFKVKDPAAFRAEADLYGLTVRDALQPSQKAQGLVMVQPDGDEGWPSSVWDDELGDAVEVDVTALLARHLVEGQVAVLEEVGFEKLRYLCGFAVAVNSRGETRTVHLGDIREQAAALGEHVTDTAY